MTFKDALIRNSLDLMAAEHHDCLLKKPPKSAGVENKGNKNSSEVLDKCANERKLMDVKKQMGTKEVLKLLRQRQGERTQAELADELGVSQSFITDLFKGRREPGEKLLKALGLNMKKVYEPVA